jgi:hypothetical protein
MSFGQQGFHLLLVTSMVVCLGARAGRGWVSRRAGLTAVLSLP